VTAADAPALGVSAKGWRRTERWLLLLRTISRRPPRRLFVYQRTAQGCFEQRGLSCTTDFKLRLEAVAYGHELVDRGDDAVLFRQRWNGNWVASYGGYVDAWSR